MVTQIDQLEMAWKSVHPNRYDTFVSIRIHSPDVRAKVEEVQKAMSAKDEGLKSFHDPAAKNHITVILLRKQLNDSELEQAKQALLEATRRATRELDLIRFPLVLNFSGLGTFSQNVLYAKIAEGPNKDRLITMKGIVESVFGDKGLARIEHKDYNPHLTITKIPHKSQGFNKINRSTYAELVDTEFGSQIIEGLELLEMSSTARDGYYRCHNRLSFSSQRRF